MQPVSFDAAYIRRLAKAKHVDMDNLPTKEEIDRKFIETANAKLARQKMRRYYRDSVWSGKIPLRFEFGKWDITKQTDPKRAKELGKQAFVLARQLETQNFNVAMMGDRGVGKTSLALAMMGYLMEHERSGMFVSTAELLRLVGDKYDDPSIAAKLRDIKRSMTEVDVLVLDDFGTEGGMTGNIKPVHKDLQDLMYQVSNARVDFENNQARGVTIMTTNNTKQQLKQMYEGKFIDRVFPNNPAHQLLFEEMKGVRNV
ncbi:ATP-binding protein [Levilactobacillus wangkuiensis]|uniref:ATP-binding protein n=1 Tax=Levilactobacillus wangkuiensis TaxID=2799566 RepID=UPI0019412D8D|nr:ATP-binding protein [Levilactobacillus wangkuiensis]